MCLPFGSMWADWVTTLVNSTGGGLLYSTLEVPMLLIPLVAWLGRARSSRPRAATFDGLTVAFAPEPRPYRPDMGHRPGDATSVAFRITSRVPLDGPEGAMQRWTVAIPPGC